MKKSLSVFLSTGMLCAILASGASAASDDTNRIPDSNSRLQSIVTPQLSIQYLTLNKNSTYQIAYGSGYTYEITRGNVTINQLGVVRTYSATVANINVYDQNGSLKYMYVITVK